MPLCSRNNGGLLSLSNQKKFRSDEVFALGPSQPAPGSIGPSLCWEGDTQDLSGQWLWQSGWVDGGLWHLQLVVTRLIIDLPIKNEDKDEVQVDSCCRSKKQHLWLLEILDSYSSLLSSWWLDGNHVNHVYLKLREAGRICRIHPNQLPKSLVCTRGSDDRDASASEHAEQEEIVGMRLKSLDRKNVDLSVRWY